MPSIKEETASPQNAREILRQMEDVLLEIEAGEAHLWRTLAELDDHLLDIIAFRVNVLAAKQEVVQLLDNLKTPQDYRVLVSLTKSLREAVPQDEDTRVLALKVDAAVFARRFSLVKAVKTALGTSGYDHEGLGRSLDDLHREFPDTFQISVFRQVIAERRSKFFQDMQQHFEEQLAQSPEAAQLVLESIEAVAPQPDELDIVSLRKKVLQAAQASIDTTPATV